MPGFPRYALPPARIWLRLALIGLLLAALWNPGLERLGSRLDLVLLVDESDSVQQEARDTGWQLLRDRVTRLPDDTPVTLLRFGATPVVELRSATARQWVGPPRTSRGTLPRTHPVDGSMTNLRAAFEAALDEIGPDGNPVLVVLSDGLQTVGDAGPLLADIREAGIPVLSIERGEQSGVWLEEIRVPDRVRVGERVRVGARLGASDATRVGVELLLDGRTVQTADIDIQAGETSETGFEFDADSVKPVFVGLKVRALADGTGDPNDSTASLLEEFDPAAIVNVSGPAPIFHIGPPDSSFLASLRAGGWPVVHATPAALSGRLHGGDRWDRTLFYGSIILENVAVPDLGASVWQTIDHSVRNLGTGLLALGGDRSFGAGAYRGSLLEEMLPVTAQPPEDQPAAAVVFLVDKSGSMGRSGLEQDRLSLTRTAILDTSHSLTPMDEVGLVAFDVQPRVLLPLDRHADPGRALAETWQMAPSGGTALAPALAVALEMLGRSKAQQKLLIVVTDGFVEGESLEGVHDVTGRLARQRIEFIALGIGGDADWAVLAQLAAAHGGRLLQVDDTLELPRLMRQEFESRRQAARLGETAVVQGHLDTSPLGARRSWPPLRGYMVTRRKPRATVYLETEHGDPLLASHYSGAGRVIALPGGLDTWATDWLNWELWGEFAGQLAEAINPRRDNPFAELVIRDEPGALRLRLDLAGHDPTEPAQAAPVSDWRGRAPLDIAVTSPSGETRSLSARAVAPGRYDLSVPAPIPGAYQVTVRTPSVTLQQMHLRSSFAEDRWSSSAYADWRDWMESGLIQPLEERSLERLARDAAGPTRPWLLAAALILWLLTIALERDLLAPGRLRSIRKQAAKAVGNTIGVNRG